MVVSLVLGGLAVLVTGYLAAGLVASLAQPLALIFGAFAGLSVFVRAVRNGWISDWFSSDLGEKTGAALIGGTVFYFVFILGQYLVTALSPLAGIIVITGILALFFIPNSILYSFIGVLLEDD